MSEADIIATLVESLEVIVAIVGVYFSVVAAYISALWFFLRYSPFLMKFVAWLIFSGALVFIAIVIIGTERMTAGLFEALERIPNREILPPQDSMYRGMETLLISNQGIAIGAGFFVAITMYLCLFYLTFFHRWRRETY